MSSIFLYRCENDILIIRSSFKYFLSILDYYEIHNFALLCEALVLQHTAAVGIISESCMYN